MLGVCLEYVWTMFGVCLEYILSMFGLAWSTWTMSGVHVCFEYVWSMFGVLDYVWSMFGVYFEYVGIMFGVCLDYVWSMCMLVSMFRTTHSNTTLSGQMSGPTFEVLLVLEYRLEYICTVR